MVEFRKVTSVFGASALIVIVAIASVTILFNWEGKVLGNFECDIIFP